MMRSFVEQLCLFAYCHVIIAGDSGAQIIKRFPNRRALSFVDQLFSSLFECLCCSLDYSLGLVSRFDELALSDILLGEFKRIEQHLFYLFIGETIRRLDLDRVLLSGPMVASADRENTVRVDQKLDLNAWQTRRLWRYAFQRELREAATVSDHLAFTLD